MIRILPGPAALARAAVEHIIARAAAAIASAGRFRLVLSGGETPRHTYLLLADAEFARRVDWARVEVFWGDERCVPPDDSRSNYRMARETLLDRVPILPEHIFRIHVEDGPAQAALAYEQALKRLPADAPGIGSNGFLFDLVLLGLGNDGHTASLFPGQTAVRESAAWVVPEFALSVSEWRVTLTPVAINPARAVTFLVSGGEKAGPLHEALEGSLPPDLLPARAIMPATGDLTWLVDAAASSRLERSGQTSA